VAATTDPQLHISALLLLGLKHRLAACCRILHQERVLNYSGHVSARVPGRNAFLIHPFDKSRAAVAANDILICDFDCRLETDSPRGKPPIESAIHAEIYRARPDVQAVAHTHSELAAAFTLAQATLLPMKSHAARWASGIPTHPDPSHITTPEQGRELAATLAHHHAALLRAHGSVMVAESVEALLVDCVHFDENARAQVQALAIGPLLPLTVAEIDLLERRSNRDQHVQKLWAYYVENGLTSRLLDSDEALLP
jgi:ribulose-5-phosphate 4-epimerase/fuculose-1-phosphate aldolase